MVLLMRIPSGGREMIGFLLKLVITFFVIFSLYWGAIEFLWEEDKISDEWHDFINNVGQKSMAGLMIGSIVILGLMLIWCIWKGV